MSQNLFPNDIVYISEANFTEAPTHRANPDRPRMGRMACGSG